MMTGKNHPKIEDTSFGRLVLALEVATEYNNTSSGRLTLSNAQKKRHPNNVHLTNLVERYRTLTKDVGKDIDDE